MEYAVQNMLNHTVEHIDFRPMFNPSVEYFCDSNRRRTSRFRCMTKSPRDGAGPPLFRSVFGFRLSRGYSGVAVRF